MAGMQGMGVNTPRAAAVAEATVGLARDMHVPKVGMFTMGLNSMIVAAGVPALVLLTGKTLSVAGAAPKLHIIIAPETTSCPMAASQSSRPEKIEKNLCQENGKLWEKKHEQADGFRIDVAPACPFVDLPEEPVSMMR